MSASKPLVGQSAADLTEWVVERGQPAFRGKQLHQWIYKRGVRSLSDITVFSKAWREQLQDYPVGRAEITYRSEAKDGTVKFLLELEDGEAIETVGIPTRDRLTVCVSSQVGCAMACDFCATGKGGLKRNLAVYEIVDQVLTVQQEMDRRVSNIVFMGMGEPLQNLPNVIESLRCLNEDIGIGQRHITVSTVGIPNQIRRFAQHKLQVTLAVSLHAPNQELRHQLIPSADQYPIQDLIDDCRSYVDTTGRRVSFEYILLGGVNDRLIHADQLADLVGGFQSHVNVLLYNPISDADYKRPDSDRVERFINRLKQRRVAASVRRSRGLDADAACGQLRRRKLQMA
ncbi:MAG: 23S rRNA (adenine(2503)-C(2))-methyltransferase RlmN, partial [Synechococcus sp.]